MHYKESVKGNVLNIYLHIKQFILKQVQRS